MRRFAQKKDDELTPQERFQKMVGYETSEQIKYKEEYDKYLESEKKIKDFCADLKNIGIAIKSSSAGLSVTPYSKLAIGLSNLADKLIAIGDDVLSAIDAKNKTLFGLQIGAFVTAPIQPTGLPGKESDLPGVKIKTPTKARFIPLVGDVANFAYTLTLKPEDFINPIKNIFSLYKCDPGFPDHPKTKAPLMSGIYPNFNDHPELDDQYRLKFESASSLASNLAALIQNVEAVVAYISILFGQYQFTAAVRLAGGIVQTILLTISTLFSPNLADLAMYSLEGFEGGGIDPSSPFSFLNKIPIVSDFLKKYEAKPIAEESKKASESRVQNFILVQTIPEREIAVLKDTLGNFKALKPFQKWDKWNITLTKIAPDHVEYKDSSGKFYSARIDQPAYSDKNLFDEVIKDAANLSSSGVKGDVNKLLSKKMSFIISLVYQLKNKYPWIGDGKNARWTNLQSDILSHINRPEKQRQPTPKPAASTPKPTAVPNLRDISIENYKQKYFREDQSQLIPERRGSAVRVKLDEVMTAIKSGTLSQTNWDKWSDIGKQAIIEEAIDRLQNAGYNVINPANARMTRVPPISKDILNQLSPKYKSLR